MDFADGSCSQTASGSCVASSETVSLQLDPVLSPDETRVAFCMRRLSGASLWATPVTGGTPVQISEGAVDPSWSPDGRWIAYLATKPDGTRRIYKARFGSQQPPVDLGAYACRPDWSPVDDWILCVVNPPLRPPMLISSDGKRTINLPAGLRRPGTWSPDGSSIYLFGFGQQNSVQGAQSRLEIGSNEGRGDASSHLATHIECRCGRRLTVSPDGKFLAGTVASSEGDIWILDGFQPPRSLWARLWLLNR